MTRWLALGLLAAAVALYFGLARPMQRQGAALADEFRKTRDERRDVRSRLQRLDRRGTIARAAVAGEEKAPGEVVRAVRRSLVRTVEEAGLSSVRLSVRPGRPPVAATVQLAAEGSFDDVVRFTGLVARPEAGVILQRVRLTPRARTTGIDLDAVAIGGAP